MGAGTGIGTADVEVTVLGTADVGAGTGLGTADVAVTVLGTADVAATVLATADVGAVTVLGTADVETTARCVVSLADEWSFNILFAWILDSNSISILVFRIFLIYRKHLGKSILHPSRQLTHW